MLKSELKSLNHPERWYDMVTPPVRKASDYERRPSVLNNFCWAVTAIVEDCRHSLFTVRT